MSTDLEVWPENMLFKAEEALRRSFQRGIEDYKPVTPAGGAASDFQPPPVTMAMDAFAMDQPSAGNTQALKPLIEPINNIPFVQLCWYAAQGFIGYQICALVSQHWLVDKACTMPARDAMRHGYDIATTEEDELDPDVIEYIKKRDKEMAIKQNCVEFVRFNRIFGVRIALPIIETNEKDFYTQPFNIDGVKPGSYKGISQIDPYWITPELDFQSGANPASMHFYEPTWWRINGVRIHRSHLLVIRNGQVPDILKPSYLYGGIPLPQKICERIYAAERTANEAPQMAVSKRTTYMKMDTTQAIANQAAFERKMQWFTQNRDNYGVKIGGLTDEMEQFDTSLSDFDDLIMTQYALVAAIADVPVTKLLGTSPGGFNSGGEYEGDSYHEFLETIQMNDMQPLIERHHQLLMKSEIQPKFGKDFEIVVVWNSTDTPTAKEQAEINSIKATTAKTYAEAGALDGQDIRTMIIADKDSGYNGLEEELPEGIEDVPVTNKRIMERVEEDASNSGQAESALGD